MNRSAKCGSACSKEPKLVQPSKKQRVDDNTKEVNKVCRVVNSLNSLWVCKNAMNPKYECIFCLCNECYLQIVNSSRKQGQRNTRGRRHQMKSVDDTANKNIKCATTKCCKTVDHHSHNLNQFGDSLYFTSSYKQKILNNNLDNRKSKKYVPFLCSKCKKELTDK